MSFFIFLCCIILGVKAGNIEIVDLHHEDVPSIESTKILTSEFDNLQNLENEVIEDYMESKFTKFQPTMFIV